MHPPVTAEQKEAMRELRDLLPPTFPRLAKIARLHVTTVREIASRENWPKPHLPQGTVMLAVSRKDLIAEEAARETAAAIEALGDPAVWPSADSATSMSRLLRTGMSRTIS